MALSSDNPFANLLEKNEEDAKTAEWLKRGKSAFDKNKGVIPATMSVTKPGMSIDNPFNELLINKTSEQVINKKPKSLKEFFLGGPSTFEEHISEAGGELPLGIKEGFLKSLSAIRGKEFKPSPESNTEWGKTGRSVGELLGEIPAFGAIAAPIAVTGGAAGFPILGAALGGATAGALTTPGDVPGRAMGALEGAVPVGASKIPLSKIMNTLLKKVEPRKLAQSVQLGHDVMKYESNKAFNKVAREAEERGINTIPMEKQNLSLIENTSEYLPKTKSMNKLIERAKTGDYASLRKLQSDIGEKASEYKSSPLAAERDKGKEASEIREEINDLIHGHFEKLGHNDLSELLKEARGKYRNLQEIYYEHPSIGKMVHAKTRKIPKNPLTVLSEDSEQMRRIRKLHPEIAEEINLLKTKKDLGKDLKKASYLLGGTGLLASGVAGTKYLLSEPVKKYYPEGEE